MSLQDSIPERFQLIGDKLGPVAYRRNFVVKNGAALLDVLTGKSTSRFTESIAFAFADAARADRQVCVKIGGRAGDQTMIRVSLTDGHDANGELTPMAQSLIKNMTNWLAIESKNSRNYSLTFYGFDPDLPDLMELWRPRLNSTFTDGTRLEIHTPQLCHIQRLPTDSNLVHGSLDHPCSWSDACLVLARHGANQFTEQRPWEHYIRATTIKNQQEIFV